MSAATHAQGRLGLIGCIVDDNAPQKRVLQYNRPRPDGEIKEATYKVIWRFGNDVGGKLVSKASWRFGVAENREHAAADFQKI